MKRLILFEPGYDFVAQPTEKHGPEYGRHGMNIRFILKGDKGAIQFLMYTDWMPRIQGEYESKPTFYSPTTGRMFPMAADIGYHSLVPQFKRQQLLELWDSENSKPLEDCPKVINYLIEDIK